MMTALATILTFNTLKRSNSSSFIVVGLLVCILVFYLKDLSLALGQTNRIPLNLATGSGNRFKFICFCWSTYKSMKSRLIIIFIFIIACVTFLTLKI